MQSVPAKRLQATRRAGRVGHLCRWWIMLPLPRLGPLLTVDDFLPHVGSSYRAEAVPQLVDIRLDEVLRRPGAPWMARERPPTDTLPP